MMVPSFTADDVDVLFEWLLSAPVSTPQEIPSSSAGPSGTQFGLGVKARVLELFFEEFRQKPHLEHHLRIASGTCQIY